jgi:hypothetical protein
LPSPIPTDFRTKLVKLDQAPFLSNGHAGGRYDADVYVNGEAKDACLAERGPIPVGTRLVMEHREKKGGAPGPLMMMEKKEAGFDPRHGDWRYVAVDATEVNDGALVPCATCHDEAPHDHVFRSF